MQNSYMAEKRVLCVSWYEGLAVTRELLLRGAGFAVVSALREQSYVACREDTDLMILGDSVPRKEKVRLIDCFRAHTNAPVLSLLNAGQEKLPEATYSLEATDPNSLLHTVRQILS